LEVQQIYREPELKVIDLAHRLGTAEHKLSRLITQALGEKNFNQMLNRHRIAYACGRLADADDGATILDISGDAGFASLGPFNRAFKTAMGCTPTAYRALHRASPAQN
jgi:AraC-like DNA-binding protein